MKLLIITLSILSLSIGYFLFAQRKEVKRLKFNIEVLNDTLILVKAKNGQNVAKIGQLSYKVNEFKKYEAKLISEIKNLRVRIKDIREVVQVISEIKIDTVTILKDTIINSFGAKKFNWADDYTNITGFIEKDTINISYTSKDTIDIINVVKPHKFLFFKWGEKYIETYLTNKNKSAKIIQGKSIKIYK